MTSAPAGKPSRHYRLASRGIKRIKSFVLTALIYELTVPVIRSWNRNLLKCETRSRTEGSVTSDHSMGTHRWAFLFFIITTHFIPNTNTIFNHHAKETCIYLLGYLHLDNKKLKNWLVLAIGNTVLSLIKIKLL